MVGSDEKTRKAVQSIEQEIQKLDLESEMREAEREGEQVQVVARLDGQEIFTASVEEDKDEGERKVNFTVDQSLIGKNQVEGLSKMFGDRLNLSVADNSWNISAPASISGSVAGSLGALGSAAARRPRPKEKPRGFFEEAVHGRIMGQISDLEDKWKKHGLSHPERIKLTNLVYGKQLRSPRHFLNPSLRDFGTRQMIGELEEISSKDFERKERIRKLNLIPKDEVSEIEGEELRRLRDIELKKTWLQSVLAERLLPKERENVAGMKDYTISEIPLSQRFGFEIKPYTKISSWDLMTESQRRGFLWYVDNQILRIQRSIVKTPQKSGLWWMKKKIQSDAEKMFDDVDEEIYCYKAFQKEMKKHQKELEDMEEELVGYDRFTVEEEKQIKSIVSKEMADMKTYEELLREP